jgi:hypothetical protein
MAERLLTLRTWLADRLPHIQSKRGIWGDPNSRVFRIFGFAPHYRLCLFDYIKWDASAGQTRGPWYRIRLLKWTIFEGRPNG